MATTATARRGRTSSHLFNQEELLLALQGSNLSLFPFLLEDGEGKRPQTKVWRLRLKGDHRSRVCVRALIGGGGVNMSLCDGSLCDFLPFLLGPAFDTSFFFCIFFISMCYFL